MQRYSGGLKVPKHMTEIFTGKTSGVGTGQVTLNFKYTPKSFNHIMIPDWFSSAAHKRRQWDLFTFSGATLVMIVQKPQYSKPDTPVDGANSGGAGADPHSHALNFVSTDVSVSDALNELQGPITVHYEVG